MSPDFFVTYLPGRSHTAEQVRQRIAEIIDLADQNVLDVMRSRVVEQEVLDILDEPATR